MCIRHAYFVKHRPARWSCCKNESQKEGSWDMDTESPGSIQCETFLSRKLLLPPYFFPASSIHKPYSKKPPRSMSQSPPARNYPTPKKNLLIRRHLLVSALAQRDPQAPDASVGVSQGSDIFAKAALQKSGPVCTHTSSSLCPRAAVSVSIFRVSPSNIFLDRRKRKHPTMFCLKITTLRLAPTVSKPLSVSFQSLAAAFRFLTQGCVCTLIIPKQPASYFPYFTFEMQFAFYCIYSQLVGSDYFTLFS